MWAVPTAPAYGRSAATRSAGEAAERVGRSPRSTAARNGTRAAGDLARPHERVEVIAFAGHEHALRQQAMVLEGRLVGDEEVVPAVIDQRRPLVGSSAGRSGRWSVS